MILEYVRDGVGCDSIMIVEYFRDGVGCENVMNDT